jgi:two-component system phosphate regulon sensor histidine kinase PhoR
MGRWTNFYRRLAAVVLVLGAAIGIYALAGMLAALLALAAGLLALLLIAATAPPAPAAGDVAATLNAIAAPVLVIASGVVIHANADARALLGQNIIGKAAMDAIPHPAARVRLERSDAEGDAVELVGLGRDDQRWEMRVGTGPEGQRIIQLVDQTGGHTAEKMRVDFVANASHELRTPLAAILGFAETLSDERGELDQPTRARFLKVILDQARRMNRLVEDLISLSRIEAEKHRAPEVAIDLAALAADVQRELVDGSDPRGADIVTAIAPAVPPVTGDSAQLSQLLHNLLGNAMKYGRPGTPITLSLCTEPGNMVRIAVADRGEGIPAKHLPRLTERFYRVDSGRSRSLGGTGLGLAIVKHIVERHRGRLDITSVVGEGTEVAVLLPAAVIKA